MKQRTLKLAALVFALLALVCLAAACGKVTHEVVFDADGGSAVVGITVADGQAIGNAPHSEKEGCKLKGWSADGGETLFDFSTPVTRPMTLKAVWENVASQTPQQPVTVTFEDDGKVIAQVTIEKGGKVFAPDYSKEGFELVWKNGGDTFAFDTAIDSDLNLVAEFSPVMLTVTVQDADGLRLDEVEVAYGQAADIQLEPTHWAYPEIFTFSGWDKPIDCVKENMTVTAVYDYKSLPESLFYFNLLDDGTYEIAVKRTLDFRYMNLDGDWGVPATFNNKPVSKIASYGLSSLYKGFKDIDLLYIPESVKIVDAYAFDGLDIPRVDFAGLEQIWAMAFFNCAFELNLPASLCEIEPYAFFQFGLINRLNSQNDRSVNLSSDCESFFMSGLALYSSDGSELVYIDYLNRTSENAELVVPDTVKTVYPALLWQAWGVTSVVFEGDVETIGSGFLYNNFIQSVTFNGTVERIEGAEATYELKGAITRDHASQLKAGAFQQCSRLSASGTFVLPTGLKYIGDYAFAFTEFGEINLDGIEFIGKGAFFVTRYTKFHSITVANSDKYYSHENRALIEKGTGPVFNGKAGDTFLVYAPVIENFTPENGESLLIDTYTVPQGVTAFHNFAFNCAYYIKHLIIPEGVQKLPMGFINSNLTSGVYNPETQQITEYYFGVHDISLPSTLTDIESYGEWCISNEYYPALTLGENFTGFVWPNGCNLEKIEYYSIHTRQTEVELPATVTDYSASGYGNMYLENITVEEGNGRYLSFGGWLYEKIGGNELRLVHIPRASANADGKLIFPDTGEYILTEIASNAAYGIMKSYDNQGQIVFDGITEIEFPDTVRVIDDLAFNGCGDIKSLVFPEKLEYIGDYAFMLSYVIESITFKGVLPPQMGQNIFIAPMQEPLANATIHIPNGTYACWSAFLAEYGKLYGINYFKALETPQSFTYNFESNGGTEVESVQSYDLWSLPYTEWAGEGERFFQGWFTKDGSVDGDWGERVFGAPYVGKADSLGVVTLYARFGEDRYEDGSDVPFAFVVSETTRKLTLNAWTTTFFEFTPERDGLYLMKMNFDHVAYSDSGFGTFDKATNTVNGYWHTTVYDENWNVLYLGFECKAGQTYYIFYEFSEQNVYTGEIEVPLAEYEFTVEWQGEIPAQQA